MPLSRRQFLATAAAPLGPAALAQTARPNVVVFLSDDMGYADIGCYGAQDIRTPHIDKLAREGVRFTDFYSSGPVCTPTRAALMTGRYQQRAGLEWALIPADKGKGLTTQHVTLARMLKDAGYATGIFGKWHLGMEPEFGPNRHGFDEFFGLLSGNVDMYSHQYRTGLPDLWENEAPVKREGYLTEMLADRAVAFIKRNAARPFFAYVPFNAVHWPFQGPGRPQDTRTLATWYDGTRAQDYKPMLEAMDAAVGKVMAALPPNTLAIFTNDNGGERLSDNRPFFHHKATLWEGGIRVPAMLRWPEGRIPAGKTCAQPAATMDLAATILAAAGVAPARPLDGIDLLPIARGAAPLRTRPLFWRITRADRKQKAVREVQWKYILDGDIELLFDVVKDPGERVNLFYRNRDVAARLRAAIAAWETDLAKDPPPFQVL